MAEKDAGADVSAPAAAYQLEKPTLATARAALEGFYGPHTDDVWRTLLFNSGLSVDDTSPIAMDRLISAMQVAEPMIRLCARGLALRAAAYERLVEGRERNGTTA